MIGSIRVDQNGYERVGSRYVHRMVVESVIGRSLTTKEIVHHVDGGRTNNKNNNLVLCPDSAYHLQLHARQRVLEAGGHPFKDKMCSYHKTFHSKSEFSSNPGFTDGLNTCCRRGTNEYRVLKGLNKDKFDWKARLNQQYRRLLKRYTKRVISWL